MTPSVTIFVATGDQPLKNLRHEAQWMKAIRACPLQAHWLEGEPISPVLAMSGIADRYRRFVVDGRPVATGFVAVADAWACTNPSAGRGLTVGFLHALRLRDALRAHGDDPRALAEEFDRRTEAEITPWYEAQIAVDRARFGEMVALREGREPTPPANDLARRFGGLMASIAANPDLFRDALEYIGTVTPLQEILERPAVIQRLAAAREALKDIPRPPIPGPTRGVSCSRSRAEEAAGTTTRRPRRRVVLAAGRLRSGRGPRVSHPLVQSCTRPRTSRPSAGLHERPVD